MGGKLNGIDLKLLAANTRTLTLF